MIKLNINIKRYELIKLALLQLNKEYVHGSHGPNTFDCSGFVWYLYNEVLGVDIYRDGIGVSTTTRIMTSSLGMCNLYDEFSLKKDITYLRQGDILFFHRQALNEYEPTSINKYPGHCGIYLEDNKFIHCSGTKKKVLVNSLNDYWQRKLVGNKIIISD